MYKRDYKMTNENFTDDIDESANEDEVIIADRYSRVWNNSYDERKVVREMASDLYEGVITDFNKIFEGCGLKQIGKDRFVEFIQSISSFNILTENEGLDLV